MNAADEPGIACPKCGCRDLRVLETRKAAGRVTRRRECRHCGRRITTLERTLARDVEDARLGEADPLRVVPIRRNNTSVG